MKKKQEEKISNRYLYISSLITKLLLTAITVSINFNLSLFYDTISNKENKNWDTVKRKKYLSYLTSSIYIGRVLGALFSTFLLNFSTKKVINFSGILHAFSYIFMVYGDFNSILFGRFLGGFSYEVIHIVTLWWIYEVSLPSQRGYFYSGLFFFIGTANIINNSMAKFDDNGPFFWKKFYFSIAILSFATSLFDLIFVPYVDSFTYFFRNFETEEVSSMLNRYYDKETSKYLISIYKPRVEEGIKIREEGLISQIIKQKEQVLHILLMSIFTACSMVETFHQFGLMFLAKNLDSKERTSKAKTFILYSGFSFVLGGLINTVFNLANKRKSLYLASFSFSLFSFFLINFSYFLEDLELANWAIILGGYATPGVYSAFYYYSNDVLPPSLIFLCTFLFKSCVAVHGYLIPFLFDFEVKSFNYIANRMLVFSFLGVISYFFAVRRMIESDKYEREEVIEFVRDGEGGNMGLKGCVFFGDEVGNE